MNVLTTQAERNRFLISLQLVITNVVSALVTYAMATVRTNFEASSNFCFLWFQLLHSTL